MSSTQLHLVTLRNPRSPLRINGERGFLKSEQTIQKQYRYYIQANDLLLQSQHYYFNLEFWQLMLNRSVIRHSASDDEPILPADNSWLPGYIIHGKMQAQAHLNVLLYYITAMSESVRYRGCEIFVTIPNGF